MGGFQNEPEALLALGSGSATAADLQEIAGSFPALRPVVAAHPLAYPALLEWLRDLHDPQVDAELARRAGREGAATAGDVSANVPGTAQPEPEGQPEPTEVSQRAQPPVSAQPSRPAWVGEPIASSRPAPDGLGQVPPGIYANHRYPSQANPRQPSASHAPGSQQYPGQPYPSQAYGAQAYGAQAYQSQQYPGQPYPSQQGQPYPSQQGQPYPGQSYPVAPGGGPSQPPKKRSTALIAAIVAAALLLVGGGVYLALTLAKPKSVTAGTRPQASVTATAEPSAPAPTDPASPSATAAQPSEEPSDGQQAITCWDDSLVAATAECPVPASAEDYYTFLNRAFPSVLDHESCVKRDSSDKSDYTGTTVMWDCELGRALLRYRAWENASDAERHYGRKFGGGKTRAAYDLELVGYDQPISGWGKEAEGKYADEETGTERYVFTAWMPEYRLSVSAEGDTRDEMRAAFDLVRMVSPSQLLGGPSDQVPTQHKFRLLPE